MTSSSGSQVSGASYPSAGLTGLQCESLGYAGYTRYIPAHTQLPLAETRKRTYPEVAPDLGPASVLLSGYGYLWGIIRCIRTHAWCYCISGGDRPSVKSAICPMDNVHELANPLEIKCPVDLLLPEQVLHD